MAIPEKGMRRIVADGVAYDRLAWDKGYRRPAPPEIPA